MEAFNKAFGHTLAIVARVGWKVFQAAVLNVLFLMDEEHLEIAIEQDVDLLPLALIYAPEGVQAARQLAGRMGRAYDDKITLEASLKWLKEQCIRKKTRYYDIIVNLPPGEKGPGSNPGDVKDPGVEEVFPPPGADMQRVEWFWGNVKRLKRYVFFGEMPESSKRWGVEHLRWLAQQQAQGTANLDQLLETAKRESQEKKQN